MRALTFLLPLLLAVALPSHAKQSSVLPGLTEGQQYTSIEGGKQFQQLPPGKIEVVEVFAYWCPHCAHMHPKLEAWKVGLPQAVKVSYMPAAFRPDDPFTLGYFAADAAKAVPLTHARMFEAVHEKEELAKNATLEQIAAFYVRLPGVNAKAFNAALADKSRMEQKVRAAREFQLRSKIPGTPSMIVDGRYLVLGNNYDSLLANTRKIIDAIAAGRKPVRKTPAKPSS